MVKRYIMFAVEDSHANVYDLLFYTSGIDIILHKFQGSMFLFFDISKAALYINHDSPSMDVLSCQYRM